MITSREPSRFASLLQKNQDAVERLAAIPGLGVDSAQQIIAEVGATAATFASAKKLSSWVGACPGKEESAGVNRSRHSPKGNRQMRRILNQAANAAIKRKGSIFEIVYRRLVPRLGHNQTIGVVANRLCHLIDPGRPGVPPFGRQIYNLRPSGSTIRPGSPPALHDVVRRKLRFAPSVNRQSAVRQTEDAARAAHELFRTTIINCLVLDFDDTVCGRNDRFGQLPSSMLGELERIASHGSLRGPHRCLQM